MSEKNVQFNEDVIEGKIKELVRGSVEETLNELLEAEAEKLTQAAKYERSDERRGYRSGHYSRNLTTLPTSVTTMSTVPVNTLMRPLVCTRFTCFFTDFFWNK